MESEHHVLCSEALPTTQPQVNIDMNTDFEGSLKRLELKDGIEGVQELKPADEICEILPNPLRKHLHIVVERPSAVEFERPSGEFVRLVVVTAYFDSLSRCTFYPDLSSYACTSRESPSPPCIFPERMGSASARCQLTFRLFQLSPGESKEKNARKGSPVNLRSKLSRQPSNACRTMT